MSSPLWVSQCILEVLVKEGIDFREKDDLKQVEVPSQFTCVFKLSGADTKPPVIVEILPSDKKIMYTAFLHNTHAADVPAAKAFCAQANPSMDSGVSADVENGKIVFRSIVDVSNIAAVNLHVVVLQKIHAFKAIVSSRAEEILKFAEISESSLIQVCVAFLKEKGIKFIEHEEANPSSLTCIYKVSEKVDFQIRMCIRHETNILIETFLVNSPVFARMKGTALCKRGESVGFSMKQGVIVLSKTIDAKGVDFGILKARIEETFMASRKTFNEYLIEIVEVSRNMSDSRVKGYIQTFEEYIKSLDYVANVGVDRGAVEFQITDLDIEASLGIVRNAGTVFCFLKYPEVVPDDKLNKLMEFICDFNSNSVGILDLNIDSGRLRYTFSFPRFDLLSPAELTNQLGAMLRAGKIECKGVFPKITSLLGIKKKLGGDGKEEEEKLELLDSKALQVDFSKLLGVGSHGRVYLGRYHGAKVAVKDVNKQDNVTLEKQVRRLHGELQSHVKLKHPNIVTMYGLCQDEEKRVLIVMEYCERKSLDVVLQDPKVRESMDHRKDFAEHIVQGMMCLHSFDICHGDLKPLNVLVTKHFEAKITDFGISKRHPEDVDGFSAQMAPEVALGEDPSKKSDVYSFGMILYQLVTLEDPWKIVGQEDKWRPSLDVPNMKPAMRELISKCWHQDPDERPEFHEILPIIEEDDTWST